MMLIGKKKIGLKFITHSGYPNNRSKENKMKEISLKNSKKVAKIQTNGFTIDELIKELVKEKERIKNKDKIIYKGEVKSIREENKKIIFEFEKGSFYLNLIDSKFYHQNEKIIRKEEVEEIAGEVLAKTEELIKVTKEPWIKVFLLLLSDPETLFDLAFIINKSKILFAEKIAKQNWSYKFIKEDMARSIFLSLASNYTDAEKFVKDHFWFLDIFDKIENIQNWDSRLVLDSYLTTSKNRLEILKTALENHQRFLTTEDIDAILSILKYNMGYNIDKLLNYIFVGMPNQGMLLEFVYYDHIISDDNDWVIFDDYVRMNKIMNNNDFEKYPRYLKTYHDISFIHLQAHRDKTLQNKLIKITSKLKKYEYKNEEYSVICPKSYDDLLNEGKKLHHCVASYGEKLAEGKTIIMFVRNNQKLDIPFVTIEIKNIRNKLTICQSKGKNNSHPDDKVLKFLDEYKKVLNKIEDKVNV